MADDFSILYTCPVCNGTGIETVWQGAIDEEGNALPPGEVTCHECNGDRKLLLGTVTIPQLDDILDKCNDIINKCNDILEIVST